MNSNQLKANKIVEDFLLNTNIDLIKKKSSNKISINSLDNLYNTEGKVKKNCLIKINNFIKDFFKNK